MEAVRQALAIAFVFGFLAAALVWLRRRGNVRFRGLAGRGRTRRLEPVEKLVLGPSHTLHLVKCGDRAMLIAAGASGCTLLEARPWSEAAEAQQ